MALFKISRGSSANLPVTLTEGYCWYTYDDSKFYIDHRNENGQLVRKAINAKDAETLTGASLSTILNSSDIEIPTSKAVLDAIDAVTVEIYNTAAVILSDTQEKIEAVNARIDDIEVGGGSSVEVVQETGDSETAVMSQKAVSNQFDEVADRLELLDDFNADISELYSRVERYTTISTESKVGNFTDLEYDQAYIAKFIDGVDSDYLWVRGYSDSAEVDGAEDNSVYIEIKITKGVSFKFPRTGWIYEATGGIASGTVVLGYAMPLSEETSITELHKISLKYYSPEETYSAQEIDTSLTTLRTELVEMIQSSAQQAAEEIILNGEW